MIKELPRHATRLAVIAALAGLTLIPATPASARVAFFLGLPPVVVGPPVVAYPPPYYYPGYYAAPGYYYGPYPYAAPAQTSAPASSAQTSQSNTPYGSICSAGIYTCPAAPQSHVGTGCACPAIGAPSYGTVR